MINKESINKILLNLLSDRDAMRRLKTELELSSSIISNWKKRQQIPDSILQGVMIGSLFKHYLNQENDQSSRQFFSHVEDFDLLYKQYKDSIDRTGIVCNDVWHVFQATESKSDASYLACRAFRFWHEIRSKMGKGFFHATLSTDDASIVEKNKLYGDTKNVNMSPINKHLFFDFADPSITTSFGYTTKVDKALKKHSSSLIMEFLGSGNSIVCNTSHILVSIPEKYVKTTLIVRPMAISFAPQSSPIDYISALLESSNDSLERIIEPWGQVHNTETFKNVNLMKDKTKIPADLLEKLNKNGFFENTGNLFMYVSFSQPNPLTYQAILYPLP